MSPEFPDVSRERPILLGRAGTPRSIPGPQGRSSNRVQYRNGAARTAHIDDRFDEALEAFATQVNLAASINAADPQLVLVLEAVEDRTDLAEAARRIGLEILLEADTALEPDEDYALSSIAPTDPMIHTSLHAVCANQAALGRLRGAWVLWKQSGQIPGNAPLRDFFTHLRDVRPWGPQDRLKMIDWDEYFSGLIPDQLHPIEIELWFRRSDSARTQAENQVKTLIQSAGGRALSSIVIPEIGYHGISCEVPTELLIDLAQRSYDQVQLVKSANVMYLRVTGQAVPAQAEIADDRSDVGRITRPRGEPVVCILDGVPVANHPLLDGRLTIFDPDDLAAQYSINERRHGTATASIAIWGDLSESNLDAAARPVLVRPILAPATDTVNRIEEVPREELVPDLMWRAFRELFEADSDGAVVAPEVVVMNLSVGDPSTPFDSVISSWARMLDWLSYHYGVLVIVSAGNHARVSLTPHDAQSFTALSGDDRRLAILDAQQRDWMNHRLLSPAESINALTVGAIHSDRSSPTPGGYVEDPTDGLVSVSPVTALGGGYRRSVKPELAASGGRAVYPTPMAPDTHITFRPGTSLGPGIRVAHATSPDETHTLGTSAAAALVTRQAARLYDELDRITRGQVLTRRQRAVAIKALLAHGTDPIDDPTLHHPVVDLAIGNGVLVRDFSRGCASNEAVVLFIGALLPKTAQDLLLPLPDGLSAREVKRVSATLAWLSPVNWRHRQYRQAALSFTKPGGDIPGLGTPIGVATDLAKRGSTTVQHLVWETDRSFAGGRGSSLSLTVKCFDQAGYEDVEPIDYAVAVSLWVAPTVGVDVYAQVRDQIQVAIRPRPVL